MERLEQAEPLRTGAERLAQNKTLICCLLCWRRMAVLRFILKIALDFIALCVVALPLLFILLWGEPFERGYFESDNSIRYPFVYESISAGLLAGVGFALIIVTVLVNEVVRCYRGSEKDEKSVGKWKIPGWVWESYVTIGVFLFGAVCQQLIVNVGKYSLGRLRPHFYDVCRPVPVGSGQNELGYIVNYHCQGPLDHHVQEARLSFPSAHSSFGMYTAVFFVFYIQHKGKWRGSKLLRHLAQFSAVLGAWYVGLSRVVENKHHSEDVAAGFLIGALVATLVYIFVIKPKRKGGLPSILQDIPINQLPIQLNQLPRAALR